MKIGTPIGRNIIRHEKIKKEVKLSKLGYSGTGIDTLVVYVLSTCNVHWEDK